MVATNFDVIFVNVLIAASPSSDGGKFANTNLTKLITTVLKLRHLKSKLNRAASKKSASKKVYDKMTL